jgi:hypothetical protein
MSLSGFEPWCHCLTVQYCMPVTNSDYCDTATSVFVWKNPAIRMSCVCISECYEPKGDVAFNRSVPARKVQWREVCWLHRTVWVRKWHGMNHVTDTTIPRGIFPSYWTDFLEIWVFFWKSVENVSVKSDKVKGTLHGDPYTFLITSRSIVLRMKDVSDKICRENEITFYVRWRVCVCVCFFFPSKIVPFVR